LSVTWTKVQRHEAKHARVASRTRLRALATTVVAASALTLLAPVAAYAAPPPPPPPPPASCPLATPPPPPPSAQQPPPPPGQQPPPPPGQQPPPPPGQQPPPPPGQQPPPPGPQPLPDLAADEQVIGAQQAWCQGATGAGIDVALVDTGVTQVPGLDGPNKVVYGPDISFDSQNPATAYVDGYGHGTAMASIIAGNDGTPGGFQGVAPDARIVSVKVGASNGAVDVSQIIAGIDWVVEHAHDPGMNIRVLNLSLGTDSTQSYLTDPLAEAAENAWHHGIVVVVSAGNDGTSSLSVADPALDPYLIAVGAEDPNGTIGPADDTVPAFSQRGTGQRHPDVVAPGVDIMGLLDPGSTLAKEYPNAIFGRYFRGSGTSQAAAMVSGAVADMLSVNPNLTPDQVKAALMDTAMKIHEKNPNFVGSGLINLPAALTARPGPGEVQNFPQATGTGSLEASRGDSHISIDGVELTGERDIFGNPWNPSVIVPAEQSATAWNGGTFNGATWSGATWSSATWSSATWSAATWSSATWSAATWSSATWSSATWSSATWSAATWSSAGWS
jgi:serine protease AprX